MVFRGLYLAFRRYHRRVEGWGEWRRRQCSIEGLKIENDGLGRDGEMKSRRREIYDILVRTSELTVSSNNGFRTPKTESIPSCQLQNLEDGYLCVLKGYGETVCFGRDVLKLTQVDYSSDCPT